MLPARKPRRTFPRISGVSERLVVRELKTSDGGLLKLVVEVDSAWDDAAVGFDVPTEPQPTSKIP